MSRVLALSVRFHDNRYNGAGDWPPSPARVFQALVAGVARGVELAERDIAALEWLETLEAPMIAAPTVHVSHSYKIHPPNNDLDKVGGDPKRIGKIRTTKTIRPHIFDSDIPLLFVWSMDGSASNERHACTICRAAEQLYQLGRGVDMAWAWAELLGADEVESLLARHGGIVYQPSTNMVDQADNNRILLCPQPGSLASLRERFVAGASRFTWSKLGKNYQQVFTREPMPRFCKVAYNVPSKRLLLELRSADAEKYAPQPPTKTTTLVADLRDKAVERLKEKHLEGAGKIDRVLVGRGSTEADKAARLRILPLPSIGHDHADGEIRRVLVEIPTNCPLQYDDLVTAFSGLTEVDREGEILWNLIRASEYTMLKHYGIGSEGTGAFRNWRTVTPAALPHTRGKRKMTGSTRTHKGSRAADSVTQALRHAGIRTPVTDIRVQREPFDSIGECAETFAVHTRFAQESMWHVALTFSEPVSGPLVLGDGRYLGLGLMHPVKSRTGVEAFVIESGLNDSAQPSVIAQAARRSMMARMRGTLASDQHLPTYVSGHEIEGAPARTGGVHRHLSVIVDLPRRRVLYLAPNRLHRTGVSWEEISYEHERVGRALESISTLRAGTAGRLSLAPLTIYEETDPLFAPARIWGSVTDYHVTRHPHRAESEEALRLDVATELQRRGWPSPESIDVLQVRLGHRGGISGRLRLTFATAQPGPLVIGRSTHKGGGLFASSRAISDSVEGIENAFDSGGISV